MAAFSVAGKVELHGNSATLTLQLPQGEPELKIYRAKSDALMADIEAGKIQVHPSRQPIDKKKLSNAMNNVQRMLLLKGGAEGHAFAIDVLAQIVILHVVTASVSQ